MSSRLYEQDSAILRLSTLRLVGMCEAGVDLAWEEAGRSGSTAQPLPDSHPLVRTERAVWEVRAAARLLLTSLQVGKLDMYMKITILLRKLSESINCRGGHSRCFSRYHAFALIASCQNGNSIAHNSTK